MARKVGFCIILWVHKQSKGSRARGHTNSQNRDFKISKNGNNQIHLSSKNQVEAKQAQWNLKDKLGSSYQSSRSSVYEFATSLAECVFSQQKVLKSCYLEFFFSLTCLAFYF